jgi:hypothetical protein
MATISISNTLARVRAKADQRKAAGEEAYAELVTRCARGDEVDSELILKALTNWGKNVHEFQSAVEAKAQRFDWRLEASKLPELRSNLTDIQESIQEAERQYFATLADLETKYLAAVGPLSDRERTLALSIAKATDAENRLRSTAPKELLAQRDSLNSERNKVRQLRDGTEQNLIEIRTIGLPHAKQAVEIQQRANYSHPDLEHQQFRLERELKELERLQEIVRQAEQTLADGVGILAEYDRQLGEIDQQILAAELQFLEP